MLHTWPHFQGNGNMPRGGFLPALLRMVRSAAAKVSCSVWWDKLPPFLSHTNWNPMISLRVCELGIAIVTAFSKCEMINESDKNGLASSSRGRLLAVDTNFILPRSFGVSEISKCFNCGIRSKVKREFKLHQTRMLRLTLAELLATLTLLLSL